MKEFKYVVTDNEGIHARPAGELVKLVKGFESTISIEKEGKKVESVEKAKEEEGAKKKDVVNPNSTNR